MRINFIYEVFLLVIFAQHFEQSESFFWDKIKQVGNLLSSWVENTQNTSIRALPTLSQCGTFRESQYFNLERTIATDEFPWMATIIHRTEKFESLGVLIARQYILTLAHIFYEDFNPTSFIIHLGSCRLKGKCTKNYEMELFQQHENYIKDKLGHDISLVRLKDPVSLTDDIRPICLPSSDVGRINFVAQHLLMTGRQFMGSLNAKFFVLIQPLSRCRRAFIQLQFDVDDNMICASTCDNGSSYVSGSALMGVGLLNSMPDHYYLAGLLSGGKNGCFDSSPDVFQRIDRYVNWIKETIVKLEEPALI